MNRAILIFMACFSWFVLADWNGSLIVPTVQDHTAVYNPQEGEVVLEATSSRNNAYVNFGTPAAPNWSFIPRLLAGPTAKVFTVSGAYTVPNPAPLYIRVKMVGAGGSGAGSGTGGWGTPGNGGDTTFGSGSGQCTARGGRAATPGTSTGSGAGGTATLGSGWIGIAQQGNPGYPAGGADGSSPPGGAGGDSMMGPGGQAGVPGGGPFASGLGGGIGGGGGGASYSTNYAGAGGGAGGYIDGMLVNPTAGTTYAVTVGAPGVVGSYGSGPGGSGWLGGPGIVSVQEYYY